MKLKEQILMQANSSFNTLNSYYLNDINNGLKKKPIRTFEGFPAYYFLEERHRAFKIGNFGKDKEDEGDSGFDKKLFEPYYTLCFKNHGGTNTHSNFLGESEFRKRLIEKEVTHIKSLPELLPFLKSIDGCSADGFEKNCNDFVLWLIGKAEVKPKIENIEKPKNAYHAKVHALAYILESFAIGRTLPRGQRTKLEKIGMHRLPEKSGNTFYKNFGKIIDLELNSEKTFVEIAGDDWREIVFELTNYPTELAEYLKNQSI